MIQRIITCKYYLMMNYNQNAFKLKVISPKEKAGIFLKYSGFSHIADNEVYEYELIVWLSLQKAGRKTIVQL